MWVMTCILDGECCAVYWNDGTAQSGVDSYVVQSLTIKWKTKNSSDLGVITESRSTLAELAKTTLDILLHQLLQAVSIVPKIVRKIHFVMIDSTAHNLNKIIEKIKKISYENRFSFHWFYLQAMSFRNTMYHWYFIMFLNV